MKSLFSKSILALLFNMLMGALIAGVIGVDPVVGAGVGTALGFVPRPDMSLMAGLNKEIWIAEILEGFYPDWSFMSEPRDMSAFVEYNTINLAEAGVDPDVLINNSVWPIAFAQRSDVPIALPLDTYDTENTLVRNVEEIETAYDKMASVTAGHRNALINKFSHKAIHAYAPAANATATPVVSTTGATVNGFKNITLDDVDELATRFDEIDAPDGSRVLVLHPRHLKQLRSEDRELFKGFVSGKKDFNLLGFRVYTYSKTPVFNKTSGAKVAYGAAAAPSTDTISSVAFLNTEVCKAQGTIEMFADLKNPGQRGDIIGFQMRGLALPFRAKGLGAIYSSSGS